MFDMAPRGCRIRQETEAFLEFVQGQRMKRAQLCHQGAQILRKVTLSGEDAMDRVHHHQAPPEPLVLLTLGFLCSESLSICILLSQPRQLSRVHIFQRFFAVSCCGGFCGPCVTCVGSSGSRCFHSIALFQQGLDGQKVHFFDRLGLAWLNQNGFGHTRQMIHTREPNGADFKRGQVGSDLVKFGP